MLPKSKKVYILTTLYLFTVSLLITAAGIVQSFSVQKPVTTVRPGAVTMLVPSPSIVTTSSTPTPVPLTLKIASASPTTRVDQKKLLSISPTGTPSLTRTPKSNSAKTWSIQSVSSMKVTKDAICDQRSDEFIKKWVEKASELGANYVAIETPYENPSCGNAHEYTKKWVLAIRSQGMHVWHRHMPLAFEGIYNTPKSLGIDTLAIISSYIKTHYDFFAQDDIFTPIPEPQNGGIQGVTHCSGGICQFPSKEAFNSWLRDAMTVSENAFSTIGMGGKIKVGYFGFDGFVAWGDNNPDWEGILEDETIKRMGNITIDHYPEAVGDTMSNDLSEIEAKYPGVPIIIGEWGTITGGNTVDHVKESMSAARRPSVIGFNYWHMGMGGNEALITDDFLPNETYYAVQSFFNP